MADEQSINPPWRKRSCKTTFHIVRVMHQFRPLIILEGVDAGTQAEGDTAEDRLGAHETLFVAQAGNKWR